MSTYTSSAACGDTVSALPHPPGSRTSSLVSLVVVLLKAITAMLSACPAATAAATTAARDTLAAARAYAGIQSISRSLPRAVFVRGRCVNFVQLQRQSYFHAGKLRARPTRRTNRPQKHEHHQHHTLGAVTWRAGTTLVERGSNYDLPPAPRWARIERPLVTNDLSSTLLSCASIDEVDGGEEKVVPRGRGIGKSWPLGAPAVVRFEGVSKSFKRRSWFAAPHQVVALEETTLILHGPGPIALVGDSGSGKSTFLRLICGALLPSAGRVLIGTPDDPNNPWMATSAAAPKTARRQEACGAVPASLEPKGGSRTNSDNSEAVKTTVPCGAWYIDRYAVETMAGKRSETVFQTIAHVFDGRSPIRENRENTSLSRPTRNTYVDSWTEVLVSAAGLGAVRDRQCRDLSRGQLLRLVLCVGAARALVAGRAAGRRRDSAPAVTGQRQSPDAGDIPGPVLCLDEFLETEDPRVRRGVEDGCAGLCAAGVTIVFATHVMEHVDGMLASRSTATSAAIGPRTKILDVDSGGDDGGGGEHVRGRRGTVVTFTAGRAGEVSDVGACTYVGWKKGEAADRRARQVI